MKVVLRFETVRIEADLAETGTARALLEALPFTSRAQTWGEEVYFTTPVKAKLEPDARQIVEPGTCASDRSSRAAAMSWAGSWTTRAALPR
jgi:uncharacterized protein